MPRNYRDHTPPGPHPSQMRNGDATYTDQVKTQRLRGKEWTTASPDVADEVAAAAAAAAGSPRFPRHQRSKFVKPPPKQPSRGWRDTVLFEDDDDGGEGGGGDVPAGANGRGRPSNRHVHFAKGNGGGGGGAPRRRSHKSPNKLTIANANKTVGRMKQDPDYDSVDEDPRGSYAEDDGDNGGLERETASNAESPRAERGGEFSVGDRICVRIGERGAEQSQVQFVA